MCERQVYVEWQKSTLDHGTPIPPNFSDGIGVPSYDVVDNPSQASGRPESPDANAGSVRQVAETARVF